MKFRVNLATLRKEHQRIADGETLNNLRSAVDQIIKDAKKNHSRPTEVSLSLELTKFDEFSSIYQLFSSDGITRAILKSNLSNKKIKYPLKKEWITVFEKFGFSINRKISLTKYRIFCLNIYMRQSFKVMKFIFHRYNGINFQNSAVILGSKKENYFNGNLKNFGNWLSTRISDSDCGKVFAECISDNNDHLLDRYVYIDSFQKYLFPISVKKLIILFTKYLSKLRPRIIYFKQPYLTLLSLFVLSNNEYLPDRVYVTASLSWIKNPIYHFMELAGTKFIFINTSLAIDPKVNNKTNNVNWSEFSEWKEIWCVSDLQASFLQKLKLPSQPIFFNMGVPDWNDLPNIQLFNKSIERKKSIAIFDYEPHVNYFGYSSLNDLHLSFEETILQFIQEITVAAHKFNFDVYHKGKRDIGTKRSNNYEAFLNNLKVSNENFILVNPNFSARKLITNTQGTISIPFTSTSIIAKEEHKPCAYYDPNGKVNPSDKACSEIKVLLNVNDLEHWFNNLN